MMMMMSNSAILHHTDKFPSILYLQNVTNFFEIPTTQSVL